MPVEPTSFTRLLLPIIRIGVTITLYQLICCIINKASFAIVCNVAFVIVTKIVAFTSCYIVKLFAGIEVVREKMRLTDLHREAIGTSKI